MKERLWMYRIFIDGHPLKKYILRDKKLSYSLSMNYKGWKIALFIITFSFFIACGYQLVQSYTIKDIGIQNISEFRFLENHFPFISTEVTLQSNSVSFNQNIISNFELNLNTSSSKKFDYISLIFSDRDYKNINSKLAFQLLKFYNKTSVKFYPENNSRIIIDNIPLRISYPDYFDIYLFAFNKNNELVSFVHHEDAFKVESNPLDERIALDTIKNGMRIEGLTFGGLGLAILMFLLEVIKND